MRALYRATMELLFRAVVNKHTFQTVALGVFVGLCVLNSFNYLMSSVSVSQTSL